MIYSNDEGDKSIRQRNHILTCIILPVLAGLCCAALTHKAFESHFLTDVDVNVGYIFSLNIALGLYSFNRRKWLKMPGRGWYNVKGVQYNRYSTKEPAEYDEVFYQSKKDKVFAIVISLVFFAIAINQLSKGESFVLLGVMMLISGSIFFASIAALFDKSPHLKLSRQGLWTKKLGFVEWNHITRAEVREESGENTNLYLDIYLKNTVFAEAGQPDEKLSIDGLNNKEMIETVVYQMMRQQS